MFDDDYLNALPEDPHLAAKNICDDFFEKHEYYENSSTFKMKVNYAYYLRAYGFFQAFAENHNMQYPFSDLGENIHDNINIIVNFFFTVYAKISHPVVDNSSLAK